MNAGGEEDAPVPPESIETLSRDRAALAFKADALARLIGELLRAERRNAQPDEGPLAPPRLPGDNPDDALRYLLRSLGDQLKLFSSLLAAPRVDAPAASRRLRALERVGLAAAQAFSVADATGAGGAIVAMTGDLLERTGLISWPEFQAGYGGAPLAATEGSDTPRAAEDSGRQAANDASPLPRSEEAIPDHSPRLKVGNAGTGPSPTPAPDGETAGDDPLDIPLILVRPLQGDWGNALFKKGLAYLAKVYGEPADKLRPVLGDWIAQSGNDHRKVFRLLAEAQTNKISDPKSWVSDVLNARGEASSPA